LKVFSVVDELIKRREDFYKNLVEGKNFKDYFVGSTLSIILFCFVYGLTMGFYSGGLQILYSAIKIPILLLVSLYLTIPTYYLLYSLLGGKRSLSQTVILLLSSITIMATVLIALVPVNLFFILTAVRSTLTYIFTVLLNITVFTLGGFFALQYFISGAKELYQEPGGNWRPAFLLGSLVLIFVGTQMAWVLRPYFNYYPLFIRPLESNFYTAFLELMVKSSGGIGILVVLLGVSLFIWILYSALKPDERTKLKQSLKLAPAPA
jgi:hypothetical protein